MKINYPKAYHAKFVRIRCLRFSVNFLNFLKASQNFPCSGLRSVLNLSKQDNVKLKLMRRLDYSIDLMCQMGYDVIVTQLFTVLTDLDDTN